MSELALSDVVVLEIATGVAAPYAGHLLADLGAQVVKVEPPDGDPLRQARPLVGGESAYFAYLNAGKLGVASEAADARVIELARHADIVLHDLNGLAADDLEAAIEEANARAVIVSLTPYGRSGERSAWETTEFTEYAASGYGYFSGDPARPPLTLPGHQAENHAGTHAAMAALAGMLHVRRGGEGQRIEIAHEEAILSDHSWFISSWTHEGVSQTRTGSLYAPCRDGFVFLFNLVPYPNLFLLMERMDLFEDESLQDPLVWRERFSEVFAVFCEWAKTRTKQEIYHATQQLRIATSPVNTMSDIAESEQLASREWLAQLKIGSETVKAPGLPYKLTGTPAATATRAPGLGEHTDQLLDAGFAWANENVDRGNPSPQSRAALSGIRVLEVTANWAGPIAGRHLADLGADVIKVELATKPATRALIYPGGDMMWPNHFNRAGYFNYLNRNKRDICLDLSTEQGKKAFLALVGRSDVVIENNSARVMGNLGLDFTALREVNPGIIMCSMSGYGGTGPEKDYSAFGSNIEATSGLASINGYGPAEFYPTGTFYADPVTGTHGAVAILAALNTRNRTGEGQWIDMSLLEAVLPYFAQPFLEYSASGENPVPRGSRSPDFAPQGVYACAGTDNWLAISVRGAEDWGALCGVLGRHDLRADEGLALLEGRRGRHDEIDDAIAAWAAPLDHNEAARLLQAQGVPAAPVMKNWEVLSDNHLHGRGYFVTISHPEAGTYPWPGFPWRFSGTPARVYFPAPLFAQHNREV
ncbi:MAG: CoA transferase, partial [Dehalococcoidia bacterium]